LTESSDGTRTRDIPFREGRWKQTNTIFGSYSEFSGDASIVGRQTTKSEIHPEFFRNQRRVRKYKRANLPPDFYKKYSEKDSGGPFHTTKHEYWESHPEVHISNTGSSSYRTHDGPLCPIVSSCGPTQLYWPIASLYSDASLRAAGATAISLCSPLSPQVSAAAALGELRNDGLPLLPGKAVLQGLQRRGRVISALGGEVLNILFGWKPTISDMQKLAKTVKSSSEIIEQLRRDSGRPIRRHFEFPPVKSESTSIIRAWGPNVVPVPTTHVNFWDSTYGTVTKTITTETKIWFDGCFSYLLDPGDNAVERAIYHARIAQAMYGLMITPEVLWELTPYSWAIDWFTNVGDVITNISNWAMSGQTLRYGYVMREERISHKYMLSGPTLKGRAPVPFIQEFITIDKRRLKASPFGFQLDWNGFSNTQLAIVAALGISRSGL
jgi:hypothetical protein